MRFSPLDATHKQLGARMVDFAGWNMPVHYRDIRSEHAAVRSSAGIFDISHMGNVVISGPQAQAWLDKMLTNCVAELGIGQGHYTFLCNADGGVIDDLILYRTEADSYFLVLNAAKLDEDLVWLRKHLPASEVTLDNKSQMLAGIALQGPDAAQMLLKALPELKGLPKRNGYCADTFSGRELHLARTGYTGEDGFECFVEARHAAELWKALIQAGAEPCGLGARDTLRLEASLPLNGSDLRPDITPIQAGFARFVDLGKPDFIGRETLLAESEAGPKRRLVPFVMTGKTPPPRAGYAVYADDLAIGTITSGGVAPTLGIGIGLALLATDYTKIDTVISIEIRGKRYPAQVRKRPLYKRARTKTA